MLSSMGLVEIGFGGVFTVNPDRRLGREPKRVVVGLGNDHCVSTDLYLAGSGKEALAPTGIGTTGRIHIGEVVGYWDLAKILEAYQEGFFDRKLGRFWDRMGDGLRERLIKEAQKPPVLLGHPVPLL